MTGLPAEVRAILAGPNQAHLAIILPAEGAPTPPLDLYELTSDGGIDWSRTTVPTPQ